MLLKFEPNLPNMITLIRLLAIPPMAWLIWLGDAYRLPAFLMFLAIWVTDLLDGWLARRLNQITAFGKLFDPFVDKLFQLVTALALLVAGRLPVWAAIFLAVKELLMIVGSFIILRRHQVVVSARWYGKLATVLLVLAFMALFWIPADQHRWVNAVMAVPVVAQAHAYIRYSLDFLRQLDQKRKALVKNG